MRGGMGMGRSMGLGMLIGAITGNGRKKKDGKYHQPGGILLYLIVPVLMPMCALNTYFNNVDAGQPIPWLSPIVILIMTGLYIWFVAWIRKSDRKLHEEEVIRKRKERKYVVFNIKTGEHS